VREHTTALEIGDDFEGRLDAFVAGVGTGGPITGVGKILKNRNPSVLVEAVEPAESPLLSGGSPAPIGSGASGRFRADDSSHDRSRRGDADRRGTSRGESTATRNDRRHPRRFIQQSGVACGHSPGRAAAPAAKTIAVILPDTGKRYLSTGLFGDRFDGNTS
jgi:cysteine synthase A